MIWSIRRSGRHVWNRTSRRWQSRLAAAGIRAKLERPHPFQQFVYRVDVRGWAVDARDEPLTIVVSAKGSPVCRLAVDEKRDDLIVEQGLSFPSQKAGFSGEVLAAHLEGGRFVWLAFDVVRDSAPDDPLRLAVLPVIRHKRRMMARHDYGRVWDRSGVSGSLDEARRSVCGTANEEEYQRSGQSTAQHLVTSLGIDGDDRVLEIGCGTGRVGLQLAPVCREWIGADVSSRMLAHARSALSHLPNVRLHQLDGSGLYGIETASLDVVYCTGVFMHLDEWDRYRYLLESFRVLRPGGRVYFDNFSLTSPEGWELFVSMMRLDPCQRPLNVSRASTVAELETYAIRAGFEDLTVREGTLWITVTARKPL
jgi:SAM-dependent methyltransferase